MLRIVAGRLPDLDFRPEWQRTIFLDEDGTVFAPADLLGDETLVGLAAAWEAHVPIHRHAGHLYLPTWWMAREDPELAEISAAIQTRARTYREDEEEQAP